MHWLKARWNAAFDCMPRTAPPPRPPTAAPARAPRPALPAAAPIPAPAAAPSRPPARAPCVACPVVDPDTCIAGCRHSAWSRVTNCARELPYVSTAGVHVDWFTHADSAVAHNPSTRVLLLNGQPP